MEISRSDGGSRLAPVLGGVLAVIAFVGAALYWWADDATDSGSGPIAGSRTVQESTREVKATLPAAGERERRPSSPKAAAPRGTGVDETSAERAVRRAAETAGVRRSLAVRPPPWAEVAFGEDALEVLGVDRERIERIRRAWDDLVHEDARREVEAAWGGGVGRTPLERTQDQRQALEAVRDELSDDDYDAMLYAAGQNNRLVVREVWTNSAAAKAGIKSGDELVSIGSERPFNWRGFIGGMSETSGEMVPVVVLRDGVAIETTLPSVHSGEVGLYFYRGSRPPLNP